MSDKYKPPSPLAAKVMPATKTANSLPLKSTDLAMKKADDETAAVQTYAQLLSGGLIAIAGSDPIYTEVRSIGATRGTSDLC